MRTFVRVRDGRTVREAVLRELMRGGQVFYLHNDVRTIERAARELGQLVPEARIAVAHGQMRERELERVMADFYHQRFNVLVCTTIIETGIDIPTANTIIIERADKLGLAQLHQLRGRVGRSHHQAYAYLLTPPGEALTEEARKRLEAVAAADQLGAGFLLATHDLEIRGAGELLGEEQSGHIEEIGFALYTSLLERAVAALRRGEEPDLEGETTRGAEIRLGIPALIPDDYLPDVAARLAFYRRLSASQSEEELRDIQVELIDRFGLLPPPVTYLLRTTRLRQRAQRLGIAKLEGNAQGLAVEFGKEPRVDPLLVVRLVQEAPARYQLAGGNRLRVVAPLPDAEQRLACAEQLVETLASAPLKSTA
ncbi:MAG: hypothetical protein KatS3mg124_0092 [Porticoccaceae bacterium]|nr:MAG: hypothetical protein KatS3mg124_0092 [Porticoccaceae bacterium]